MKLKIKIIISFLVIVLAASSLATVAFGEGGVVQLVNDDYTAGLGVTKAANASSLGQSQVVRQEGVDGGVYAVFAPTLTGSNPAHAFAEVNFPNVNLGPDDDVKYFILELDFTTETQYVEGMDMQFIGKNTSDKSVFGAFRTFIKTDSEGDWTVSAENDMKIENERGKWQHLTFIMEISLNNASGTGSKNTKLYTYCNGKLVGSGTAFSSDLVYLHSLRISYQKSADVDKTDTFCFDNLKVTKLTGDYSGNLASVLQDPTKSLTEFDVSNYKVGYTFSKTKAIAEIGGKKYSTVSDIKAALRSGDRLTLTGDIYDTLTIPCECIVNNPGGYKFSYDKGSYAAYSTDTTTVFMSSYSPVEVKWHIGNNVITETYSEPKKLTPPSYDGYVEVEGVMCKAIGFAISEGGDVISDLGYASSFNSEFWLVYDKPVSYTVHKDNTKTYAYNRAETETLISGAADGDVINLLGDISTSLSFVFSGKSVTLNLSGYTLHMAEGGSGDMLKVGSGGQLTVKNGTVEAYRNGRIPDGSTSIVRRRVFNTSEYNSKLLVENVTVDACKMIAFIKDGEATFKRCKIDFTNDYENMIDVASTNNSTYPTTLNLIECDIKAYKTVVNTYKPSSVSAYNAIINAENCNIETREIVFSAEAIQFASVNGGKYSCRYLFGKKNNNPDALVSISEGTELYMWKVDEQGELKVQYDGALARVNSTEYPYVVAKDYATVSWNVLGKTKSEVWRSGEIPTCPIDVPQSTREVIYEFPNITAVKSNVLYTLKVKENFETKIALELGMGMSMNFYVSEINFESVKFGGKTYTEADAELVTVGNKAYYRFKTAKLSAEECVKKISVNITVPISGGTKSFDYSFSVIDYLDDIMSGSSSLDAYNLALAAFNLIKTEMPRGVSSAAYNTMLKRYNTDNVACGVEETDSSIASVSDAIRSAEIVFNGGKRAFRLGLNQSYSGEITLKFVRGGYLRTVKYNVTDGKCNNASYIDIEADATALIDGVEITVGENVGKCDIYLCSLGTSESSEVLSALYSYAKYAKKYL